MSGRKITIFTIFEVSAISAFLGHFHSKCTFGKLELHIFRKQYEFNISDNFQKLSVIPNGLG